MFLNELNTDVESRTEKKVCDLIGHVELEILFQRSTFDVRCTNFIKIISGTNSLELIFRINNTLCDVR